MTGRVLSVDDLCVAVEETLRVGLPALVEALELEDEHYSEPIKEWQQLPTLEALSSARMPVAAIVSPGLAGKPTTDGRGNSRATWRISIGFYDRGRDHNESQKRARDWVAFARAVLLTNKSLGGVAEDLAWVGEGYRLVPPPAAARTFAGGALDVDVTATNVVDLDAGLIRLVRSTHPHVTVREA